MTRSFRPSVRLRSVSSVRLLLAAGLLAAFLLLPATASAVRNFEVRYTTNDTGAIVMAANTLLTCPDADPDCAAARDGSDPNADNGDFTMEYVDVDADATTFNSSTATLPLPAGAEVLFAGLYWAGQSASVARGTVLLQEPGAAGYQTITTSIPVDTVSTAYQGFADVTAIVQAAGAGDYTVANVQATVAAIGQFAGWALVVVYRDASEPPRNLTVFDGFLQVDVFNPRDIPVSGFLTPPSGPVNTNLGFVVYEGDQGLMGDTASLNGVVLSDAAHPANNFFNSSISRDGVHVAAKNPNYVNQLGFDAFTMDAPSGALGNSETSATIRLTSLGDVYWPGVVTFATELFAPVLEASKSVVDLDGGSVEPGDVLQYSLTVTNTGADAATDVVVTDSPAAGTTYVPGSLEIGGAGRTDAAGDDQAEFDSPANEATWRVGVGASATSGGTLAIGASATVSFSVTVNSDVTDPSNITNVAAVSYLGETTGLSFETDASVSTSEAQPPPDDGGAPPPAPGVPDPSGQANCDWLTQVCGLPEEVEPEPTLPPRYEDDAGPASGRLRMPDLRWRALSASWNGSTVRVVLRLRVVKPKLVRRSVAVRLTIPGVLDRTVRVPVRARARVSRTITIPARSLSGNPEGARLAARIDPGDRVTEFRERNNTMRTKVA